MCLTSSTRIYYLDGAQGTSPTDFPFELIPVSDLSTISRVTLGNNGAPAIYDLQGRRLSAVPRKGIFIITCDGRQRKCVSLQINKK